MYHLSTVTPWRNLKPRIKSIIDSSIDLDIQQKYMHKRTTNNKDTKHWGDKDFTIQFVTVLLNKENIWWFPKDSKIESYICKYGGTCVHWNDKHNYIFENIKSLIIRYLDIPKSELLIHDYSWDFSGITEILRAADKRIGYKRLSEVIGTYIPAAQIIFNERFKNKQ